MPHTKFVDAAAPPPHVGLSIRDPSEATTRARSSQVAVYIVVFILLAQLAFGLYSRSLAMAVPPCLLLCLIRRVVSSTSTDPSHHLIYHNGSNPSWSTALTLKYSTSDIIGLFPGFEPADYNVPTYFLNQSLARDGFAGGWVEPLTNRRDDPTTLQFRVGSPTEDIAAFTAMVDKFFTVAKTGLANYNATFTLTNPAPAGWSLCLPWGCPLAKYECVQLLHFPPSDSKTYYDYLYAKTVSRWDALLMNNGLAPERVALQDRIVDIIPIAAPANDGDKLDVYAQDFAEYALQMLQVMLVGTGAGDYTLPVIASGEPVRHWLSLIFKKQVEEQFPQGLNVGNLLFLRIEGVERTVPVLIANHPSYYLYCHHLKEKIIVMRQDLISSRWNVQMVSQSQPDPATVLAEAVAAFASDDVILPFVEQQDVLFGYHAENHPYGPSE